MKHKRGYHSNMIKKLIVALLDSSWGIKRHKSHTSAFISIPSVWHRGIDKAASNLTFGVT